MPQVCASISYQITKPKRRREEEEGGGEGEEYFLIKNLTNVFKLNTLSSFQSFISSEFNSRFNGIALR